MRPPYTLMLAICGVAGAAIFVGILQGMYSWVNLIHYFAGMGFGIALMEM